jgi:hypothetical protein
MKFSFAVLLAALLACPCLRAQAPGRSGVSTLIRGLGAAAGGMGDAYATSTDDLDVIYYNPAGLAGMDRSEVSALQQITRDGGEFRAVSFGIVTGSAAFALSGLSFGEPYAQADTAGIISYARKVSGSLSLGASLKTLASRIPVEAGAGAGSCADIGVLYCFPSSAGKTRLAASVSNLGTDLKYAGRSDPFVNAVRVGWSTEATTTHWSGNRYTTMTEVDAVKFSDSDYIQVDIGLGFKFTRMFTMRMGFSFFSGTASGGIGLGFNFPLGARSSLQADYISLDGAAAGIPYNTHRANLRLKW